MASRAEAIAQKEQSLRVVEQVSPGEQEATNDKWKEFHKVLARHRGQRILVVLIGYPDPDSIASGLAHRFLAQQFDIDTTLLCFHEVSHQENHALLKQLEIDLQLYDDRFDLRPFSASAFVDTQKIHNPISDKLAGKALLSLVDHHKRAGDVPAEFLDIREDSASTSAIYTEYSGHSSPTGSTRKISSRYTWPRRSCTACARTLWHGSRPAAWNSRRHPTFGLASTSRRSKRFPPNLSSRR
jgi:hypothetical protein